MKGILTLGGPLSTREQLASKHLLGESTFVSSQRSFTASYFEQTHAEVAVQGEQIRDNSKAEQPTLRSRFNEKEEILHEKQTAKALEKSRDAQIGTLEAEIDGLVAEIAQTKTAIEELETAARKAEQSREGVDPGLDFLKVQLWVKGVALQVKKADLRKKEKALRANQAEVEELERSPRAKVCELEDQLKTTQAATRGLEESLNQQTRCLQTELTEKQLLLASRDKDVGNLRSEIDRLAERIAGMVQMASAARQAQAEAASQAEQIRDSAKAEVEALRAQIGEKEEELNATIHGLQIALAEKQTSLEKRGQEFGELEHRLAQTESAARQAQAEAASQAEQIHDSLKVETASVRTQLREKEEALQASQGSVKELEHNLGAKVQELKSQLQAEQTTTRELAKRLNEQIRGLQSELAEKESSLEARDGEIEGLKSEIKNLLERIAQVDSALKQAQAEAASQCEQIRDSAKAEVVALEVQLKEKEEALRAKQTAFIELEEAQAKKVHDLHIELAEKESLLESRNLEFREREERIAQLESALGRAHMELAAEAGQMRESARAEVEALRGQLKEKEEALEAQLKEEEAALQNKQTTFRQSEEGLGTKIYDLELQPTEEQVLLESRNGEVKDLTLKAGSLAEVSVTDLTPHGESPYFLLSNPPVSFERATDIFPLKFMQEYKFFPLKLQNGSLAVVMSDPSDVYTLDAIYLQAGPEVQVYEGEEREILKALDEHYGPSSSMERIIQDIEDEGSSGDDGDGDVAHLKDLASEAPVIRLVNLIITKAVEDRASDIHVEPFEGALRVRYRIDGVLVDTEAPPQRLQAAIISRVKLMAKMNIAERRLPQDGRIWMEVGGRDLDLRVSTIPTLHGESVVMRILDRSSVLLTPDELGFPPDVRQRFDTLIRRPNGIILVTGPTGSGKTTTLYAALSSINSIEKNIITIEDPVEYQLKGVKQIQVRPKIGLAFATGLRHIVRQDPDVILVGEIRDRETAEIAIHAALTGHLVLSTLHTNDAAGAVTRLLDMGIQNYLVSSTLLAVLAQRLVRRICPHCKRSYSPDKEVLGELDIPAAAREQMVLYKGQGCAECNLTGYFGRLGIFELLVMQGDLHRLILEKTDSGAIREKAVEQGMKTLWQDGWEKAVAGVTTLDEILRVTWEG